jgi:hypothetical protein
MPRPNIKIHNVETDQVVEREMTAVEYTNYQAALKISADQDKALADQAAAKAALLTKLGITADEAALLLS